MNDVTARFTVGDVQALFALTDAEASQFLDKNGNAIEEAMVRAGWEAIETLGQLDGLEPASEGEGEK
jgi:hypothetical protein